MSAVALVIAWIAIKDSSATIRGWPCLKFIVTSRSLHRTRSLSPPVDLIMKSTTALFLQVAIVLIGIATLTFLLWEPHVEGRNAHATTFDIYFKDPFLAYVYVGSIPFFVALYRAFRIFGDVRGTGAFSQGTVDGLKAIKYCAIAIIGFVAGAVVFIIMFGDPDDRPAGIFMSFLVTFVSSLIAVAAAIFSRKLKNALRRSEGMS